MAITLPDPFQAIADPSRRKILDMLSESSLTIGDLAQHFDMSRPAVSKHIKILEQSGLISIQDIGRERHCLLKKDGFAQIKTWVMHFDRFWAAKLGKLEALLDKKAKGLA